MYLESLCVYFKPFPLSIVPAYNNCWRSAIASGKSWNNLRLPIPFVKEKLVKHLIVEAAVEGVVAQGFLLSDFHFGLGAEQLLLCDLFLSMAARYSSAICRPVRSRPRTST